MKAYVVALATVLLVEACHKPDPPPPPPRPNIEVEGVLVAHRNAQERFTFRNGRENYSGYSLAVRHIDAHRCPPEFRRAWGAYVGSWAHWSAAEQAEGLVTLRDAAKAYAALHTGHPIIAAKDAGEALESSRPLPPSQAGTLEAWQAVEDAALALYCVIPDNTENF